MLIEFLDFLCHASLRKHVLDSSQKLTLIAWYRCKFRLNYVTTITLCELNYLIPMWIHKAIMVIVASARFITAHATWALFFNIQMPRLYLLPPHEEDTMLTPCEHEVKVVGSRLVGGLKSFSARWLDLHS